MGSILIIIFGLWLIFGFKSDETKQGTAINIIKEICGYTFIISGIACMVPLFMQYFN